MTTHFIDILGLISAQKISVIFQEYFYVFVELFLCNFVIIKHPYNILKELICDRKLILQEFGSLTNFIQGMALLLLELV